MQSLTPGGRHPHQPGRGTSRRCRWRWATWSQQQAVRRLLQSSSIITSVCVSHILCCHRVYYISQLLWPRKQYKCATAILLRQALHANRRSLLNLNNAFRNLQSRLNTSSSYCIPYSWRQPVLLCLGEIAAMAPVAASLAQSESKKRFFDRLGLDERNKLHRHLYCSMKAEAVNSWSRISAKRDALIPQLRDDPSVEPPYTFGQIDEEAIHAEVIRIYKDARKDTRIMYELGRDRDGDHEENWIIRWLLWHVFRYRDDRNSNNTRRRNADEPDATSDGISDAADGGSTVEAAANVTQQVVADSHSVSIPPSTAASSGSQSPAASSSSRFFDPVRDQFRT
ncbi:hypothetical protein AC578_6232 [Pseudocercospora eumusae]|uniref:Uncharacterized protein n=1 Tax=Pseudocercospora eumusae TaxID=321146 RepID=A0A139H3E6_9PEZI|nr:hypothetical protein AC578_6232 [Pseudocercospora eumusae]